MGIVRIGGEDNEINPPISQELRHAQLIWCRAPLHSYVSRRRKDDARLSKLRVPSKKPKKHSQ